MMAARSTAVRLPRFMSLNLQALCLAILSLPGLVLTGCATWQQPDAFDVSVLRARAESEEVKGVRLSAAVLGSSDSQQMFGANINDTGVQPVWIEIENRTNQALWLLRSGTDPDLFSPLEVAWSFHRSFASETNARLDAHFDDLSFQNPVLPGETKSGILYTNPHRKTRLLSIDILGQRELFPFTLFPKVPDDDTGEGTVLVKVNKLIGEVTADFQHTDRFRASLKQLPCCATGEDGNEAGDPVNVILVGRLEDIATALVRRGYRMNALAIDNAQRLFSRPPDIVARKVGQSHAPANWLRIWVAPMRYQGKSVFLVQAGRPLGWRLDITEKTKQILNPKVDEVRNLLIQDMLYSSGLQKLAFVTGVGATEAGEMRSSLGDTRYHTDGLRAVLFFIQRPQSLSDLELLDWHPYLKLRETGKAMAPENDKN
ncbi:MAG: LssY C-terminal domain-containing protein [Gammaproteobacteria bacterium]